MKISYFTFQEILNIFPGISPRFPHDIQTPFDWFTTILEEAGIEPAVFTLSQSFTDELVNEIINALITLVYYRHDEDYFYKVISEDYETPVLTQNDFIKAIKPLMNVIDLTIPRYAPLLQQNEIYSFDPVAPIGSKTTGKTRFNDTPQNEGDYNNDDHATNVSQSTTETEVDSGSIMSRLEELFKNFKPIMLNWSNEFNQLFLKEEQI